MYYLLVPACEIRGDALGPRTLARCERALALWLENNSAYLVVTGGIYEVPAEQTRPAAVIMRDWFVSHGVCQGRVLVEDDSVDTFENIAFSLKKIAAMDDLFAEIEVVTEARHARRFWLTFLLGYHRRVKLHKLDYAMSLKERFMEFLFLLIHLFWPKTGGPLGAKNRRTRSR